MNTITAPTASIQKSFTVNDVNGNLKEGIKHCFLSTILVDTSFPPAVLRANNGVVYQVIYDNFQVEESDRTIIKAMASFQAWEDGNFVVIRNFASQHTNKE